MTDRSEGALKKGIQTIHLVPPPMGEKILGVLVRQIHMFFKLVVFLSPEHWMGLKGSWWPFTSTAACRSSDKHVTAHQRGEAELTLKSPSAGPLWPQTSPSVGTWHKAYKSHF